MDPEKTANEWKRVLKENGIIVFSFSYNKTQPKLIQLVV